jgi:hypothetical protein
LNGVTEVLHSDDGVMHRRDLPVESNF